MDLLVFSEDCSIEVSLNNYTAAESLVYIFHSFRAGIVNAISASNDEKYGVFRKKL